MTRVRTAKGSLHYTVGGLPLYYCSASITWYLLVHICFTCNRKGNIFQQFMTLFLWFDGAASVGMDLFNCYDYDVITNKVLIYLWKPCFMLKAVTMWFMMKSYQSEKHIISFAYIRSTGNTVSNISTNNLIIFLSLENSWQIIFTF